MTITDLNAPEVMFYTGLNEKQVKRSFEPEEGAFICESARVIERAIKAGYQPISFFVEEGKEKAIASLGVSEELPVFTASHELMKDITGYSLTGGVLCAMRRKPLLNEEEFINAHNRIVVLDDVENPTNVGAIFRSATALGADGVILLRGSADPLYRRATRVSMGTVFQTDWTYARPEVMAIMKQKGFMSYALALEEGAVPLQKCARRSIRVAVVLGNEDHGISEEILSACDQTVMIPMRQNVDSLNVAAASAVAFWELFHEID